MKKTQIKQRTYLLITASLISLIVAVIVALLHFFQTREIIIQKADAKLLSGVEFLHELLGPDYHNEITGAESVSEDEYMHILNRNDNLCRRLGLQYLWSVMVLDDQIVFTSATRSNINDHGSSYAGFFEKHRDPDAFANAFGKQGVPVYSTFQNEWGQGRMVLFPRLDAGGRRYIIGASIQLDELNTLVKNASLSGSMIAAALFLFLLMVFFVLIQRYTRIFTKINAASIQITEGNLETVLPVSRITELNQLCRTLDTMRIGLKERIEKLAKSENREKRKSEILLQLTQGVAFKELLNAAVLFTERDDPSIRGSVLLLDSTKQLLLQGAAPSLPSDYNALMEAGLPIGPSVGSCGTATFTKEIAIATDIQNDYRWTPYAAFIEKTREHNLKACWSMPIISSNGDVLGAFANYSNKTGEPTPANLETLKWAVGITAIAIEKKRAMDALGLSENRYQSIISVSNTGAWEYERTTDYLWCSTEYFNMLGLDRNQFAMDGRANLKEAWLDLLHPDDREHAGKQFAKYLSDGSPGMYENYFRMRHANGSWLWIWSRGSTLINHDGSLTNKTVGTHINITRQKLTELELLQAKEKAEESDRLKSAFLTNMSHEIRTPMNGILGFAELLKEPDLTGEQKEEFIALINKSGQRMLNIINDIVDISKIEAGLSEVRLTESHINDQLDYIHNFFKPETSSKGLEFTLRNYLASKDATVQTDREKLYAILTNLVKNAIKFTHAGSIEMGCVKKAGSFEFYIKDTGIGIPKNRQEAIFERFIQADIEDQMAYQGAGLGLAITKAYVEMLGGKIWVESEEGKGSTFYFTLPCNSLPEIESTELEHEFSDFKADIRELKILVVEDDLISEKLFDNTVKSYSKEILKARTGVQAV